MIKKRVNLKNWFNIKCEYCGKEVLNVTRRRRFCSKKCRDSGTYKRIGRKRGKEVNCAYCGAVLWAQPRHIKNNKKRFCSREHYALYIQSHAFNAICAVCKKSFRTTPTQVKFRHRKLCSKKCHTEYYATKAKENRIKNGFTKHQIDRCVRYSKQADEFRRMILYRDNFICTNCNKKGGYLEVHHIKPFAFFEHLRFEPTNAKTLCKICHDKTKMNAKKMREIYANQ